MSIEVAARPETAAYRVERSVLNGRVEVSGAKNSVLRLLAASLLTPEPLTIQNFPTSLLDGRIHIGMLEKLGKQCEVDEAAGSVTITESDAITSTLEWDDRSIRNTLLILGALVSRTGHGAVPLPGGCNLGDRKYDLHVMLLEALGARVWQDGKMLCAEAPNGLKGAEIHLPIRSTGATENAIISGSLATGTTRVWNPHIRPEILDLIAMLRSMGASIEVFGQEHIKIEGVGALGGTRHTAIADNMEAITWLIASVITGGDVEIVGFPSEHLEVPLIHLRESGADFFIGENSVIVRGGRPLPVEISTGPYPGINSDMQPLFAVFGVAANGESRITDLRFPGRYGYMNELAKMGAEFSLQENLLRITGGKKLTGAPVTALDLRAGIALTLAGLTADGTTVVSESWQVERGYNDFVAKLQRLGGNISYA